MLDPNKNENWKTEFNNFQKQIAELQSAEALKPQAVLPAPKSTGLLSKVGNAMSYFVPSFFKPKLTWNNKLVLGMPTMYDIERNFGNSKTWSIISRRRRSSAR